MKADAMISETDARRKILDAVHPLPERRISLLSGRDSFAAEDYFARLPLPVFDNSAMDGYAVVANSCGTGARLRVIGEQPAGLDRQLRVSPGEAIRIFTGAPVPAGANAIVMQEDVTRVGAEIVLNVDVDHGEFVRHRGCDLAEGQKILAKGERIRPATTALLASQGFDEVTIGGEVDVAIISTGDELVKPGEKIKQGQIYESNSVLLQGLAQRCGASVRSVEYCPDDRDSLTLLAEACREANMTSSNQHCDPSAPRSTFGEWRSNRVNHFSLAALTSAPSLACPEIQFPLSSRFCNLCVRRF